MAQSITIAGASYPEVPQINIPKTGGGIASFVDAADATLQLAEWLEDNSVTVPSGATLDTLVGLLDSVETGGGSIPSPITAGDTPVILVSGAYQARSTTLANTGLTLHIPQAGTYRIKWVVSGGGTRYTVKSRLYRNGTAVGTQQTSQGSDAYSLDLACNANDQITLYLAGYNYGGYYGGGGGLCACIDWNNGFNS